MRGAALLPASASSSSLADEGARAIPAGSQEQSEPNGVFVTLTHAQTGWLTEMAEAEQPPPSTSELLRRLLDEAITKSNGAAARRAHQLEVFGASGYSEHHPDYPKAPCDVAGV